MLFGVRHQAQIALYPFFNAAGGFNVEALRQALATRAGSWKTVLVLNFPNNPTGYSATESELDQIAAVLTEAAEEGRNLVVVTDDAYFGLFYGADVAHESLFARLAGAHERLLAVKVDGPTKEQFVWGFRMGMLTFGSRAFHSSESLYQALEKKTAGAIRSADLELLARRPIGLGQGHVECRDGRRARPEARHPPSPCKEGPCHPRFAQVRRSLGAVPLQRRLFHVCEAQGHRRRDVTASTCSKSTALA